MFSKLFSLIMLFCVGATFLNAQSYYNVGQVYTFVADNDEHSKSITFKLTFDNDGKASIQRSESTSGINENTKFHYLTSASALDFEEETSTVSFPNPNAVVWIISFSDNTARRAGATETVALRCPCGSSLGTGECDLSIQASGPTGGCFTCVRNTNCGRCARFVPNVGNVLVVEAPSVSFK